VRRPVAHHMDVWQAMTLSTIGIDPGISGGIALLDADRETVTAWRMPVRAVTVGGKSRKVVDLAELAALLQFLKFEQPAGVWIEDLSGRPATIKQRQRDGSFRTIAQKGQFQQGWNCCAPVMGCVGAGLPYHLINPRQWKARLDVASDKDDARATATRMFPASASQWALKNQDGLAEAALLARYGALTL
jgi:hypothetical protein